MNSLRNVFAPIARHKLVTVVDALVVRAEDAATLWFAIATNTGDKNVKFTVHFVDRTIGGTLTG